MPYIPKEHRRGLDPFGAYSEARPAVTAGELNFQITSVAVAFLTNANLHKGRNTYADLACVLSALEGAKLEIYRRVGAALEDAAIARNGDLPGFQELLG